jgi:hypothetical protein
LTAAVHRNYLVMIAKKVNLRSEPADAYLHAGSCFGVPKGSVLTLHDSL